MGNLMLPTNQLHSRFKDEAVGNGPPLETQEGVSESHVFMYPGHEIDCATEAS